MHLNNTGKIIYRFDRDKFIKARAEKGYTLDTLAQLSGVSICTLKKANKGQTIGMQSAILIASVLDTNADDLE